VADGDHSGPARMHVPSSAGDLATIGQHNSHACWREDMAHRVAPSLSWELGIMLRCDSFRLKGQGFVYTVTRWLDAQMTDMWLHYRRERWYAKNRRALAQRGNENVPIPDASYGEVSSPV
jgi:hypothetical protein